MTSTGTLFLTKSKHNIWYYQRWMPLHFRKANPDLKTVFRLSLQTHNKNKAIRLSRLLSVKIDSLANQYFSAPEDFGKAMELLTQSAKKLSEHPNYLDYEKEFLSKLDDGDEWLLSKAQNFKDSINNDFKKLQDEIVYLKQALLSTSSGTDVKNQEKLIDEIKETINPTLPDSDNPTIEVLYERWKEKKESSIVKASFSEYCRMINLFIRIINDFNGGSVRINSLNNEMIRHYRDTFSKIPMRVITNKYTLKELITLTGTKKSLTTIKNTYISVNTFLEWVAGEGFPINPTVHKVLTKFQKIGKNDKKTRIPFNDNELQLLFNSKKYLTGKLKTSGMYWAGLISLFTGARMSEILQLEKSDIYKVENIWVINFDDSNYQTEDKDKHIKQDGSYRQVPIHKQLLKLGFIEYIKTVSDRLFPDEIRNSQGKFDRFKKRHATYRKQVNVLPAHKNELKDFHSFRHTVRTRLSEIRTTGKLTERFDEGIIDAIVGHASADRSEGQKSYNHSQYIKAKSKALNRLSYDSIDFNKITPWDKAEFHRKKFR